MNETGSLENLYTYTARERDTESNLYYYRARYYEPSVGRFIQEDPIVLDKFGQILLGRSFLYSYAGDNPIKFNDPFGTQEQVYMITEPECRRHYANYTELFNKCLQRKREGCSDGVCDELYIWAKIYIMTGVYKACSIRGWWGP